MRVSLEAYSDITFTDKKGSLSLSLSLSLSRFNIFLQLFNGMAEFLDGK